MLPDHSLTPTQAEAAHPKVPADHPPGWLPEASSAIIAALERRQLRLIREITLPAAGARQSRCITDLVSRGEAAGPCVVEPGVPDAPTWRCRLHDLSPGGVAPTLDAPHPPTMVCHRLSGLHMALPAVMADPSDPGCPSMTLDLFGILRAIETTATPGSCISAC
jgi:hypothetical protein